jgi:hypothetical protein
VCFEDSAERVGQQPLREGRNDRVGAVEQRGTERRGAVDCRSVDEPRTGVDRLAGVAVAPAADEIETLEREAERVDELMARRANRVRSMRLHALAQRLGSGGRACPRKIRFDPRRRRRNLGAEQILDDPRAADDRRRAIGDRGRRQDAAQAEEAAARVILAQLDSAEIAAGHAVDAVVARETLIKKRVTRGEQLEHAAVLAQHVLEQQLGLASERRAQLGIEAGVLRQRIVELAQLEPLPGEVLDKRGGARVSQHAPDLLLEGRRLV